MLGEGAKPCIKGRRYLGYMTQVTSLRATTSVVVQL